MRELKQQCADRADGLIGRSAGINQLRQTIERAAKANSRILIAGPSGAGKETGGPHAARRLAPRRRTVRGDQRRGMTPERMEVELFGVEAERRHARKIGALEEAHGGTLFIDEVADMPRETQSKILRVLVEQSFQRVGGTAKVQVDVRVISSTARDLARRSPPAGSARTCSTA